MTELLQQQAAPEALQDIFPLHSDAVAVPQLPSLHPQNIERVFKALQDMVRPEALGLGRPFTRGEIFRGQLESHWAAARVVSFDIFDTAIVRKCAAPRDVFLFLADHAPFAGRGSHENFSDLRQQAENLARRRAQRSTGSSEATLSEIHHELAVLAGFDLAAVPAMVAAEQLVELALCTPHPFLMQVYRRAKDAGKLVWFVSDTYHDAAFLQQLLASCGYDDSADRIVASCDERCSKGSGQLLPRLVSQAGLKQADFVHIGDNMQSDCVLPSNAGINGVWHPLAGSPEGTPRSETRERSLATGMAAWGTRTFEPQRPFWWRLGFGVAGPLLVGFSWWLHEKMREDGVKRAYFLLRDGDILKQVYDELTKGRGDAIPSALLESSRRAFMLPALGPSAPTLTSQLFVSENPRPALEFLTRLCIRTDDLQEAFRTAGFARPEELVGGSDGTRLSKLFANPKVMKRISARSAHERGLLMRYLQQEGVVGDGERVALVDIGWNATIQKSLDHAARNARVPAHVVGYYLGTFAASLNDAVSPMRGYLCEAGEPRQHAAGILALRQFAEFICTSGRGSLLHFEERGGRIFPVVGEPDHDEMQTEAIRQLHEGAVDYAIIMRDEAAQCGIHSLDPGAAAREYFRVVASPTAEEASIVGAVRHGDGMGASASRAFARFTPGNFTADSVLSDYARAYWKPGLLNQHSAQALMLRSLLWLHDV